MNIDNEAPKNPDLTPDEVNQDNLSESETNVETHSSKSEKRQLDKLTKKLEQYSADLKKLEAEKNEWESKAKKNERNALQFEQAATQLNERAQSFQRQEKHLHREIEQKMDGMLLDLIQPIEWFESALKLEATSNNAEIHNYRQGFEYILKALKAILVKYNVQEINPEIGKPLDHHTCEASDHVESDAVKNSGDIIQVISKGYHINNRVIRYAKAVVKK